jgi:ribosomal protein L16 Arg81 hydroxylase
MRGASDAAFQGARAAVDALLAPHTFGEWLEVYWQREPLIRVDGTGSVPHDLPREEDFEQLLASLTSPGEGWFSLVKGRARPPEKELLTADGWLSMPDVFSAYAQGNSLLLNQAQRRHKGLRRLCRQLETALTGAGVLLSRHIGANLYLSPPQSQGFGIHYDPHDVLILQLEGMKHWSLYRTRDPNPTEPPLQPFTPDESGGLAREFTMRPGDIIYLPRGVRHVAHTSELHSLHLTLSIEPATWFDFFSEAMRRSPNMREALPIGFVSDGHLASEDAKSMRSKIEALAHAESLDEAAQIVWSKLLLQLDRLAGAGPTKRQRAAEINSDTELQLAEGVFGKVAQHQDKMMLHLPGASFAAPLSMKDAFEYMLREPRFTARELPTGGGPQGSLQFLRQLVLGGHLLLVDEMIETPSTPGKAKEA